MLSARELAPEKNPGGLAGSTSASPSPTASALAMVPVNEVDPEGQPDLLIKRPAAGLDRRRADDHPAADLLR